MKHSHFFAKLSRMKYINRWGLMRATREENLSEHSLETSVIAHALAVLHNKRFHGHVNTERVALLALFHDATEVLTGDLPTPIKYYNPKIRNSYKEVETVAKEKLLSSLPCDLQDVYQPLLYETAQEKELWRFVKAADKLSALIKCVEEKRMGNDEFIEAEQTIRKTLYSMNFPEVFCFLEEFLPSYCLTLDEQEK